MVVNHKNFLTPQKFIVYGTSLKSIQILIPLSHYILFISMQMVVHIFLFTDMLLVTKPLRKSGDKFAIVKPVRGRHRCDFSS